MVHRSLAVRLTALLLLGALAAFGIWGCSDSDVTGPPAPAQDDSYLKSAANPNIRAVMAIQDRHTPALMADPDVVGTATTVDENGQPAILVLVLSDKARRGTPAFIDDVRVVTQVTDRIVAMRGPPSSGSDHTAKQTAPIQLGTTGGWRYDLANGYCCGGTLGSLIQVGGTKRILSNYHVFEADIVAGGNGIVATTGDPIVHPGLIDIGCVATNGYDVATLVVTSSLPNNNVDCSTANIITGMVDPSGAILEVGTLSAATVAAYVGQPVKKSGRTTGLTRSTVSALNGTVSIAYENECAGGAAFTKTFTGQIIVGQRASKFLAGGDSGSLLIQDVTTDPGAIGLLFAGSSSTAIANPIDEVLGFLGATMVGN
ncbi:MAG: hypothetical protein ABFS42_04345 [Candidatus Krumholzibacteriota bacterium]